MPETIKPVFYPDDEYIAATERAAQELIGPYIRARAALIERNLRQLLVDGTSLDDIEIEVRP